MRLELYQQETERLASDLQAMLDAVSQRLHQQQMLSALEQAGVLHALQVLTDAALLARAKADYAARTARQWAEACAIGASRDWPAAARRAS